ncbi:MAG: YbaB/EbfC family nucleoid-associated protein [Thermoanaerobaculia bacterium]|nr:YbaB/EbfC family nucleoid-associated protein [Thermoanaerobaculia bacterium]
MNIRQLMKQAQQMQEKLQRELADTVVEASVGGGVVTVKMNGQKQLLSVELDPEVIDPEDPEILQDLLVAAFNEATRQIDDQLSEKLGGMAPGIPGLGLG